MSFRLTLLAATALVAALPAAAAPMLASNARVVLDADTADERVLASETGTTFVPMDPRAPSFNNSFVFPSGLLETGDEGFFDPNDDFRFRSPDPTDAAIRYNASASGSVFSDGRITGFAEVTACTPQDTGSFIQCTVQDGDLSRQPVATIDSFSQAIFADSFTNDTGAPVELLFSANVFQQALQSDIEDGIAEFSIALALNGRTVKEFGASINECSLFGTNIDVSAQGVQAGEACGQQFILPSFSILENLGRVEAGASATFSYTISFLASATRAGLVNTVRAGENSVPRVLASLFDPAGFAVTPPTVTPIPPSGGEEPPIGVPLPGTLSLLGAGVAGLALRRRRA